MKAKRILAMLLICFVAMTNLAFADVTDSVTISSLTELAAFRDAVNGGDAYEGKTVTLTTSIDLSSVTNWEPIGTGTRSGSGYTGNAFKGVFDGGNFAISNLTVSGGTYDTVGLFGVLDGGTIKNLKLENASINVTTKNAGSAVGLMVNGATVENITASGSVAAADGAGGVVGRMTINGTISNCVNNANVSGAAAGGIVGKAYYTGTGVEMNISNCTNSGTITSTAAGCAGGIAGFSAANVSGCTNSGTITSTDAGTVGISLGGIVGWQQMYGEISNNTNNGLVTSEYYVATAGGIVGWANYQYKTDGTAAEYPVYEVISVKGNTNTASIIAAQSSLGSGGIVGGVYNAAVITNNVNLAEKISGYAFASGILGNYQAQDSNGYHDAKVLTVENNITTTVSANITANCVNDVCYDNVNVGADYATSNFNTGAKIGNTIYGTFAEAMAAASAMTGDVTVELYDKVTLNSNLSGSYSSITFVGKTDTAEIYLDVQGYITATGKNVAFTDLTLSKAAGGFITNAGFMNVAFGVYDVPSVTYTNCYFANGAYASSGTNTFTNCTFMRSHDKYGLWAYGDADIVVDGCTFADYRGVKMYAEDAAKTTNLTVKNTDFSALDGKPAIVLTYGESVVLEGNTYSSTGVFELDLDGAPNGTSVTSDVTPTCINDNGVCGVLVDGKIYTTVAQAAEVATAESTVTLLHDSTETVEFVEGVTLDKNGYTAENVTVATPPVVVKIGDDTYTDFIEALNAAEASDADEITVELLCDINLTGSPLSAYYKKYHFITNVEGGVTVTFDHDNWVDFANGSIGENVTFKASYFLLNGRSLVVKGNIDTGYLYTCWGATTTIEETAVVNVRTGDATVQVKGGNTVMTVKGTLNCGVINVWNSTAKLIVSGENAKVNTYWFDCWDGTPSALIENGATMVVDHVDGLTETMSASRGGSITVNNANLKVDSLLLGHDGTAGVITVTGDSTFEGTIKLTTATSTVTGPAGLNVITTVEGYEIVYSNGAYGAAVPQPTGTLTNVYTSETGYWGECGGNASESFEFKFYNDDTYMGYTSLNNIGGIIDGDVYVSWNIKLDAESNTDEYWTMAWDVAPTIAMQPNRVEQWVDGVKVAECAVEPNWSDSIFPVVAAITDDSGKILSYINNRENATLANAFANGGNIVLLKDVTLENTLYVNVGKKVVLDLNGKTIGIDTDVWVYGAANSGTAPITVCYGGDLTIEDSSENKSGLINGNYGTGLYVYDTYAAVMMTAKGDDATNGTAKLTVNSGTLKGFFAAVAGNKDRDNTEIVINGGKLTVDISDSYSTTGIEHPMNGKLTINGGIIEGMDGISFRSGQLLITDGTIIGNAPATTFDEDEYWDNDFAACTGHALQIVSRASSNAANETPSVEIRGGKFTAENTTAIGSYAADDDIQITGFISGGTFSSDVTAFLADGYEIKDNGDGTYGVIEAEAEEKIDSLNAVVKDMLITYDTETGTEELYQIVLLSGIDSLNYSKVGFEITVGDVNKVFETNKVFTGVKVTDRTGTTTEAGPKAFGENMNYIFGEAFNFDKADGDKSLTFKPFAVKLDGTTIYGEATTVDKIYEEVSSEVTE